MHEEFDGMPPFPSFYTTKMEKNADIRPAGGQRRSAGAT
jgi:hypothetical protein